MDTRASPVRFFLLLALGGGMLANGVVMLLFTQTWYACMTGATLAFNQHFVSDVGAAYLATGGGLVWAAYRPAWALPLVTIALAFSALHAGLHVRDYFTIGMPTRHWLIEALGIWAPVALLGWLALTPRADAH
jgi:hypothetical protein